MKFTLRKFNETLGEWNTILNRCKDRALRKAVTLGSPSTGVIAHVHPEMSISKQQTHQSGEPIWHAFTQFVKKASVSYDAVKSRKTAPVFSFCWNPFSMKVVMAATWSQVLRLFWKPAWFRPPSATVVSAEPFSHGTGTLRYLQKEMVTYRHWSVSLWRDPDDVPHCRILSPDKTEWRLISATLCRWRRCFEADQLLFTTHAYEKKKTRSLLTLILVCTVLHNVYFCSFSLLKFYFV